MKYAKTCTVAFAALWTLSTVGCDRGGSTTSPRRASPRMAWINQPESGRQVEEMIEVPGAGITFEVPDTLYVFKECQESEHTAGGPDGNWVPIVRCARSEQDDSGEPIALTFYLAAKDMLINERSVATLENQLTGQGFKVEEAAYYDEYLSKPGRRGIFVEFHTLDDDGFPINEIRRFMFPKDDVIFIVETEFPFSNDRSGINRDWQRINWSFQLDEDGPLYSDE